jgi:ABC-type lipoprotein release transport system permease subunit
MLFGLQPGDPGTIVMALLIILLTALAAGFVPARRASMVDTILALRNE